MPRAYIDNLHARWFRTAMDIRSCPAPKDIKNCEGVLTCTPGAASSCPAPQSTSATPATAPAKPAK
jgi:hypothetical protein